MKLLDHLSGWWRSTEADDHGVSRVVSFQHGGAADPECYRYRCDEWTAGDNGHRKVYSETGYLKHGALALATSEAQTASLKCSEKGWAEGAKEGELLCTSSDGALARHFRVSKYSMEVAVTSHGTTSTTPTLKDNVNWKYV
eukprot:TRINITY_DN8071_c0_g1_i1.p2 TRINITY_DN8071_c0_g1~~TRINITY_DN8071_c0_g1_i1.p2  ORF type:complete len:164 (+),score=60.24 TRINITY_DN8071_c0_g1_i1:71-493(+)